MSNLRIHAERELRAIGMLPAAGNTEPVDEMNQMMSDHVLELVDVFSKQGHSGFSGSYCIGALEKVLRFEPLGPLTGADSEWNEVSKGMWQNNRCGRVFKDADGQAYDSNGRVFVEPNGCAFTSRDSRVYITFPYTPKTEYVQVAASSPE